MYMLYIGCLIVTYMSIDYDLLLIIDCNWFVNVLPNMHYMKFGRY